MVSPCGHCLSAWPWPSITSNLALPAVKGANFGANWTTMFLSSGSHMLAYWDGPVGESSLIFGSFRAFSSQMLLKRKKNNTPAFVNMVVWLGCDLSLEGFCDWTLDPWAPKVPVWKVVELSVGRRSESLGSGPWHFIASLPGLASWLSTQCEQLPTVHLPLCLPRHDGLYH